MFSRQKQNQILMDVTQALKDAEYALRDFIASVLSKSIGSDWVDSCGVSEDRVKKWKVRKEAESKRQEAGVVEERLLYYADFYDLKTILKKHWSGEFSASLGDWKTMEVWLSELEKLRDPAAHRRELLPHQKHLVLGISGEIRNRLVRYRSKQESTEDYYPRIESARDSLGNIWIAEDLATKIIKHPLRVDDVLDFVVTARDPQDAELEFGIGVNGMYPLSWQNGNAFSVRVEEKHRPKLTVNLYIRSPRKYHEADFFDDIVQFIYAILPPQGAI
jgi:Swt1-like HEPN